VHLLAQIELTLKKDYGQSVWPELETLSMLLCGKPLATSITDAY
jgi:DNA polymerase-3 subunit delta